MHYFSLEKLYHFFCGKCSRWWSIGDWAGNALFCPHCGYYSDEFQEKKHIDPVGNKD